MSTLSGARLSGVHLFMEFPQRSIQQQQQQNLDLQIVMPNTINKINYLTTSLSFLEKMSSVETFSIFFSFFIVKRDPKNKPNIS